MDVDFSALVTVLPSMDLATDFRNAVHQFQAATFEPVRVGPPLKRTSVSPCQSCDRRNSCQKECIAFRTFSNWRERFKPWSRKDVGRFDPPGMVRGSYRKRGEHA